MENGLVTFGDLTWQSEERHKRAELGGFPYTEGEGGRPGGGVVFTASHLEASLLDGYAERLSSGLPL